MRINLDGDSVNIPVRRIIIGVLLVVISLIVLNGVTTIQAGSRGVVLEWGAPSNNVWAEGLHFKIPFYQKVIKMNVQMIKAQEQMSAASKDMQTVTTTIAVNFHPDPNFVNKIYQNIGVDYQTKVIDPRSQEAMKAITANYNAAELISRREEVRDKIKELLSMKLRDEHFIVDDVSIVNFRFSKEFENAVESKQKAEQDAQREKNILEQKKYLAEQKIVAAQAEAESLRLQKQQITPELLELRKIERDTKAIEKWDGSLPSTVMGGGAIPFINLPNK